MSTSAAQQHRAIIWASIAFWALIVTASPSHATGDWTFLPEPIREEDITPFVEVSAEVAAALHEYAEEYAAVCEPADTRLNEMYSAITSDVKPKFRDVEELHQVWHAAFLDASAVEADFLNQLRGLVTSRVFEQVSVRRRATFYDLAFLNQLPETRVDLDRLLDDAGVTDDLSKSAQDVLMRFLREIASLRERRMRSLARCVRDAREILDEVGYSDDEPERDWGQHARMFEYAYRHGAERAGELNLQIAAAVREAVSRLQSSLEPAAAERLRNEFGRAVYPELFRRDPLARFLAENDDAGNTEAAQAYMRDRRRLQETTIQRIIAFRSERLALDGRPKDSSTKSDWDSIISEFVDESHRLRSQTIISLEHRGFSVEFEGHHDQETHE